MLKRRISASQIDLFRNCQLQWKFRYLDRIPEDEKFTYSGTLFGKAFHKVFETILQVEKPLAIETKKDTITTATEMFKKEYITESDSTKLKGIKIKLSRGESQMSIVEDYTARFRWGVEQVIDSGFHTEYKKLLTEQRIEFDFDEFHIDAIMDIIGQYEDGSYDILDFKTGRFDPTDLPNNTQLIFYTMAGYQKYGRLPNRFRFLCYDRSTMEFRKYGTLPGQITDEVLEKFKAKVEAFRSGFKEAKFAKRDPKQKDMLCGFCQYKASCKSVNQ